MDELDLAITKDYHRLQGAHSRSKCWEDFEAEIQGKSLFLFGIGVGADFYYYKYGAEARADGIIDNNTLLQGHSAQPYLWETIDSSHKDICISSITILDSLNPNETVILVTSLNRYQEISVELEKRGFINYFVLVSLEANSRLQNDADKIKQRKYRFRERLHFLKKSWEMPIVDNKIVLYTETEWAGHGKEIVEQLLELRSGLDIVWIVRSLASPATNYVRTVLQHNYAACIQEWETAKVWLADTLIDVPFPLKKEGQIYIQVKHWSSVTLKQFGYDYAKSNGNNIDRIRVCDYNRDTMDYLFVGSPFDEKVCRAGLDFSGNVVMVGSPRSDVLFRQEQEQIRHKYAIPKNKRVLLYAPTFRLYGKKWSELDAYSDLDFEKAKQALELSFGGEWIILLRMHPVAAAYSDRIKIPEYVQDVSGFYDGEELVLASDVMITDYSSIMFEPALINKPVFLLATDLDKYLEEERNFLMDYNELPFPIARSNKELAENIINFDEEAYVRRLEMFFKRHGVHEDGHAGERAARFILDLIDGKRS